MNSRDVLAESFESAGKPQRFDSADCIVGWIMIGSGTFWSRNTRGGEHRQKGSDSGDLPMMI